MPEIPLATPQQSRTDGAIGNLEPQNPALLFDENYYQTGLGLPYERNEYWLGFFAGIAEHIIRSLKPRRVLDAGCAMGMLMEAFWDRGVEAWGIDISPFAISRVRPDMRPYCRQASLSEPIEGQYDLVTCIEVLEHLHEQEARAAAANIAGSTDRILFSSTPDDFGEATHFTVRPPIYWLKLFAELGFWPDLEYDANYITPHAMLLRRLPEGLPGEALTLFARSLKLRAALVQQSGDLHRLKREESSAELRIQELLAARGQLEQSLAISAEQLDSARLEITALQEESTRLTADYSGLQKRVLDEGLHELRNESAAELHQIASTRDRLQAELNAIVSSPGWKVIDSYRKWYARQMANKSWLVRLYEPALRWCLQRAAERRRRLLPGSAVRTTSGHDNPAVQPEDPAATENITYEQWIQENEPDSDELRRQTDSARALSYRPLLSVILPVYRVDPQFLEDCVRSVLTQTYENWELCVADGCPEAHENRAYLSRLAAQEPRVKLALLDDNGGISRNSNAALKLATGEFAVLLDHDDTLAPFALYEVVARLSAEPDLDVLYSDHDYLDTTSGRFAPLFKPDWSPEVMLSANYITHLTVIRSRLFDQLGGFDPAVDSAQDWDFFFRAVLTTQRVAHLPKVLYHWRTHASSTALNTVSPTTTNAQLQSIQRYLDALGWPAQAEIKNSVIHIRWLKLPKAKISVIIPSKDKVALLQRCVQTVLDTTLGEALEILIVDNGSTEADTLDYYQSLTGNPTIRILRFDRPFNYSAMNNFGAVHASGDYFLFLNNDTEAIQPGWLQELLGWAQLKEIGVVGAKLLLPTGEIQHAGVIVGLGGFAGHPFAGQAEPTFGVFGSTEWYRNYLAVTGACMLMRREVFHQVGGFDESFISCGSDVELCLRLRTAGYRGVYNPFARLLHHECATRKGDVPSQDFFVSFRHYRSFLERGDPYWNSNLSPWKNPPALRRRPEQTPLEFAGRMLERLSPPAGNALVPAPSEEKLFVNWFDFSEDDIRRSQHLHTRVHGYQAVQTLVWFIPEFRNPYYGGICTILRFADYLRRHKGVSSYYAVSGADDAATILRRIRVVDPGCSSSEVSVFQAHDILTLPPSDACVATLWTTAYSALRYQDTKRKFYFIQDYEPLFYRAGTASGLVESTYRFGFYGIANTISICNSYRNDGGQLSISFSPCIDSTVFFPPDERLRRLKASRSYRQLFCYTRPNHPRNAFELLSEALRNVKARMGDGVRIVCAGDEWSPKDYGLENIIDNLGTLDYRRTAQLYRESDAGIALMFTRHPSYIPLELMACGALVISNRNRWTEWLLKHGDNCLLTQASATCLTDSIIQGLENTEQRTQITATAQALIQEHYTDWGAQISRVYDFMCDPTQNDS